MAIQIRTPQNAWTRQQVIIDSTVLVIELYIVTRTGNWVINLYDADDNLILGGISLRENQGITPKYYREELPSGGFYVLRVDPSADVITRTNLGRSFELVYLTEVEIDDAGLR